MPGILVSLVTYNDEAWVEACLESVRAQSVPVAVRIFDNSSKDRTRILAGRYDVKIHHSPANLGYSAGHNWNLRAADFDFGLLLNADVILEAEFIERLLTALSEVEGAGMAGGKLYRMDASGQRVVRDSLPILDSTGLYFTPTQRHFDRGSEERDRQQYDRRQLVFGITGAALLLRRELYDDLRLEAEFLDEDFFAYREDADLAWRAQIRGWKAVYEPQARALHLRKVLPTNRRQVHPLANYHSVKNRFLMRRKNMDSAVRRRCFPYMWLRDLGILAYLLLVERSSLAALLEARRLRDRMLEKRFHIQKNRRIAPAKIARLFSFQPWSAEIEEQV